MRDLTHIVIHGSWTGPRLDIGASAIRRWHLGRGFNGIGYHMVIRRDGTMEEGRPLSMAGAHVKNHNQASIGICLVGGRNASVSGDWDFNYNAFQLQQMERQVLHFVRQYSIPPENVIGHRDFPGVTKDCPGFDVRAYFKGVL